VLFYQPVNLVDKVRKVHIQHLCIGFVSSIVFGEPPLQWFVLSVMADEIPIFIATYIQPVITLSGIGGRNIPRIKVFQVSRAGWAFDFEPPGVVGVED
jgi:hypothetical protein